MGQNEATDERGAGFWRKLFACVPIRDPSSGGKFNVIPAAVLALLASLAYGSSDFVAGVASRRVSSVAVALWSQIAGAAALYRRSGGLRLPPVHLLLPVALVGLLAVGGTSPWPTRPFPVPSESSASSPHSTYW